MLRISLNLVPFVKEGIYSARKLRRLSGGHTCVMTTELGNFFVLMRVSYEGVTPKGPWDEGRHIEEKFVTQ